MALSGGFVEHSRGVGIHHLGRARLANWQVPLPPRHEQRRIVDILEDHLGRLDAATVELARAEARLKHLLTVSLLRAPELADADFRPLGKLLAEELINGRSVPTREGGFPVLRMTSLKSASVDLHERKEGDWTEYEARPFLVRLGDFLVSRGNGSIRLVGRGALVDQDPDRVAFPDTLIRVRAASELVLPEYLTIIWNSPVVRRQIEVMARTTAGIFKINQKHLESVTLPVPDLESQRSIVARVHEMTDHTDRLRKTIDAGAQRSSALRRALLAAAFSGRLTGRQSDLDRAEEKAGV